MTSPEPGRYRKGLGVFNPALALHGPVKYKRLAVQQRVTAWMRTVRSSPLIRI
jgi:hypothetical protein